MQLRRRMLAAGCAAGMLVAARGAAAQSSSARGDQASSTQLGSPTGSVTSAANAADAPHWRKFALGFVSSILFHESAHLATSLALGARPTFGFDQGRPTVYSGFDLQTRPHDQFIFSAAGLTAQTLLDEALLDIPHGPAGPFERGVLAGGLGTTIFYLTIGRTGYVSDIEFMARVHGMTKTQSTLLFGSIASIQMLRIHKGTRFPDFFVAPAADGRMLVGVRR